MRGTRIVARNNDLPKGGFTPRTGRADLPVKAKDQRGLKLDTAGFWAGVVYLVGSAVAGGRALDLLVMVLVAVFAMMGQARQRRTR